MKKLLSIAAMISIVFFSSCAKEETSNTGNGDVIEARINLNLDDAAETRAVTPPTPPANALLRYVIEAYNASGTTVFRTALVKDQASGSAVLSGDANPVTLRLPRVDGNYTVVVWADFVANTATNATASTADKWYDTQSGLKSISLKTTGYVANDPEREAFFSNGNTLTVTAGAISSAGSASNSALDIVCKRAVAQISFFTQDISMVPNSQKPLSSNLKYESGIYTAFNASTGTASSVTATPFAGSATLAANIAGTPPASYVDYDKTLPAGVTEAKLVYRDIVLASSAAKDTSLGAFDLNLYNSVYTGQAAGTLVSGYTNITNIPVQANYRTNVFGYFLTLAGYITVSVDSVWANPDNNTDNAGASL